MLLKKIVFIFILLFTLTVSIIGQYEREIDSGYFPDKFEFNNEYFTFAVHNFGILGTAEKLLGPIGRYKGDIFLWSGGFFLSGFADIELWANTLHSPEVFIDYTPGSVNSQDSGVWVVKKLDKPFGESWNEWSAAVDLGAGFWDGNKNGIYDPIDLNSDGEWNENEDAPEILGDITVWTIYNDGVPEDQRDSDRPGPLGIELRQTVYSYNDPILKNAIFIRYEIINTGLINDTLSNVIFGPLIDEDLGEDYNDLMGSDTIRKSVFAYEEAGAEEYPLTFYVPLLNGPAKYIPGETFIDEDSNGYFTEGVDVPLDSARFYRGKENPEKIVPGAKNLSPISSMVFNKYPAGYPLGYIFSIPANVEHIRNYMEGKLYTGEYLDPCEFKGGEVIDMDCNDVNPVFFASGDPVDETGWLDRTAIDNRMIMNVGKFDLVKDEPAEILLAYVVGQGNDNLNSIEITREYVDYIHEFVGNDIVVSVDEKRTLTTPSRYTLSQNYPNPFNPLTKINFYIPEKSNVQLKIFDILGREISTLMNEEKAAGSYEVEFNASILSSGIYFYRLKSGSFTETKKMMLIK